MASFHFPKVVDRPGLLLRVMLEAKRDHSVRIVAVPEMPGRIE